MVERGAVVGTHPAHLLTVARLPQQPTPEILIVNKAISGGGVAHLAIVLEAMKRLGLADRIAHCDVVEDESFASLLAREPDFHRTTQRQILDWLLRIRPEIVLGDAFEL